MNNHYALNYMVYGKSHQYISSMFISLQLGLRLLSGRVFVGVTSSCLVWWVWLRRCGFGGVTCSCLFRCRDLNRSSAGFIDVQVVAVETVNNF